jgi:hypothetical protein
MKKLFFASQFLSAANVQIVSAATGSRSGEEIIVLLVPILIILLLASGYWIRARHKAKRERDMNATNEAKGADDTTEG